MPGHAIYGRLRNAIEIQALADFEVFGLSLSDAAHAGVAGARRDRAIQRVKHVKDVMKRVQTTIDKTILKRKLSEDREKKLNQRFSENSIESKVPQEYAQQLTDLGGTKFKKPSEVLKTVMLGVLVILGVRNPKWEAVRPWLKRNKMCDALESLNVATVSEEQIAEMEKLFADAHLTTEQQVSSKVQRFSNKYTVLLWLYQLLQKIKNLSEIRSPMTKIRSEQTAIVAKVARLNTILARLKKAVAFVHTLKACVKDGSKGEEAQEWKLIHLMEQLLDDAAVAEQQFAHWIEI